MKFGDWLLLMFIGLKLTHVIDWSWWWVLSPLPLNMLVRAAYEFTPSRRRAVEVAERLVQMREERLRGAP